MRAVASTLALALSVSACVLVVNGKLDETEGFERGEFTAETCFRAIPKSSCSTCIETKCAEHVVYACNNGAHRAGFDEIASCAKAPYLSGGAKWACGEKRLAFDEKGGEVSVPSFDDPALTAVPGDPHGAASICIRDQCLAGGTPKGVIPPTQPECKLCEVSVRKPDAPQEIVELEEHKCGQCLREKCGHVIVHCCQKGVVPLVEPCAYVEHPPFKVKCADLANVPPNGPPAAGDELAPLCSYAIRECFKNNCVADCQ